MKPPHNRTLLLAAGFTVLGLAMALLLFGGSLFRDGLLSNGLFGIGGAAATEPSTLPQVPEFTQPAVGVVELGATSGDLLEVGDEAYPFSLPDVEGNVVSLSDFRGRPVMLNFWATWCLPCRIEMPELQEALLAYQEDELAILSINEEESKEAVQTFFAEFDLSLTALLDSEGTVGELYRIINMPATVFINPEGQVTAIHRGILSRSQIDDYLAETMNSGG
jgi:peroxiredoxin